MIDKIKLGKFSYTNVVPIYFNLEEFLPSNCCALSQGPPSLLNSALADEILDISPVSAFSYALFHEKWLIVPKLSISCKGEVISVFLASDLEFDELDNKRILLTNESASAASLLRVLFFEKGLYPEFYCGDIDKLNKDEYDAALVIGDNALFGNWDKKFKNIFDLGKIWNEYTNLPFVFGLWAVSKKSYLKNRQSINQIITALIKNKSKNIANNDEILNFTSQKKGVTKEFMAKYFKAIEYDLSSDKIKGLKLFYDLLHKHGLITSKIEPKFMELNNE